MLISNLHTNTNESIMDMPVTDSFADAGLIRQESCR